MISSCDPALWKTLKTMLVNDNIAGPKGKWTPKKAKLALEVYLSICGRRDAVPDKKMGGAKKKKLPARQLLQNIAYVPVPMHGLQPKKSKSKPSLTNSHTPRPAPPNPTPRPTFNNRPTPAMLRAMKNGVKNFAGMFTGTPKNNAKPKPQNALPPTPET